MATLTTDALCTLAELKEVLNITGTSYDTRLTLAINIATRRILSYLDRTIASTVYTEDYDGNDTPILILKHFPVIGTPTQVNQDGNRDFLAATNLTVNDDYVINATEGMLRLIGPIDGYDADSIWPKGKLNVRVAYTAGYATIPEELNLACRLFAGYLYKKMGSQGNKSYTIGQISVVEDDHLSGIPNSFRSMMEHWRRTDLDEIYDDLGTSEFL